MTCVEVLWLTVAVLVAGLLLMVLVTQLVPPRKRCTHFCDECGSLYDAVEAAKYGRGAMRVLRAKTEEMMTHPDLGYDCKHCGHPKALHPGGCAHDHKSSACVGSPTVDWPDDDGKSPRCTCVKWESSQMVVFKVRPTCGGPWLFCQTEAEVLANIGGNPLDLPDYEVVQIEMTQAEFDAMPEFDGW